MERLLNLPFNQRPATVLHIDLNSCFATIEQQAFPKLRGRPLAVAAYTTDSGCVVAPSIEAKTSGVKTGMRVKDARLLCPDIIVVPPDPAKYRAVHQALRRTLGRYTDDVTARSIDEFVLDLAGTPALKQHADGAARTAQEIKTRIRREIGDWLTVSIGIAPNTFLAKTAAGLHKPDGLDTITRENVWDVYRSLELTDLCGIAARNAARLHSAGIYTIEDMCRASADQLKRAFRSILGLHWYMWLRGWESGDVVFDRKSFGHAYALPDQRSTPGELAPILAKLVHKAAARMRADRFQCQGVHVSVVYRDHDFWHRHVHLAQPVVDQRAIHRAAYQLLDHLPHRKPVRNLGVSVYDLTSYAHQQLSIFDEDNKTMRLVDAIDEINARYGPFCITPGIMVGMNSYVPDRISFGSVKALQDSVFGEES